ncbi:MAG TPA: tetratricopeptide repeat protein, partial [Candidatus Melainabacteria bacterium]|nr:tetratricopeptide repeat protein [Candidatus Melainabacteria bacterium]
LAMQLDILGAEHENVAQTYSLLSGSAFQKKDFKSAEAYIEKAYAIRAARHAPDHPDLLNCFNNYVDILAALKKYKEAEALCRKVVSLRSRTLGAHNIEVSYAMAKLAEIYQLQGKHDQAEPVFKQAIEVHTMARGREGQPLVDMLRGYSRTLLELGQKTRAAKMETRARAIADARERNARLSSQAYSAG